MVSALSALTAIKPEPRKVIKNKITVKNFFFILKKNTTLSLKSTDSISLVMLVFSQKKVNNEPTKN